QEWFQLHPSPQYQLPTSLFLQEGPELLSPETYLVLPEYRHLFRRGLTPVILRLAVTSMETIFLWDMKMPQDGRMTDYYISLQEAADAAEKAWVRLEWNNPNRAYDYHLSIDDLGEPQFPPDKTMRDWLQLGFKGRVIDREDHPVILEYQGRKV